MANRRCAGGADWHESRRWKKKKTPGNYGLNLGFAFLEAPGRAFRLCGRSGPRKILCNMLAGAAGVDLVLLVMLPT